MKQAKIAFGGGEISVSRKMGGVRIRLLWNLFVLFVCLGLVHISVKDHRRLEAAKADAAAAETQISQLKDDLAKAQSALKSAEAKLSATNTPSRTNIVRKGEDTVKPAPPPPKPIVIERVDYDKLCTLKLRLSAPADEDVLREYIKVSPVNGATGLRCSGGTWSPCVEVTGDFPYRKPITLRVRAGFPAAKDAKALPLAEDFTYTFTRIDARPEVGFAASGRYLPPDGKRLMPISSINVTNLLLAVARVPPANIVQILAREEREYSLANADADSKYTSDLTDTPREWKVSANYRLNERSIVPLAVNASEGAPSNGVFLVMARSADKPREDWYSRWDDDDNKDFNPLRHRLVCITDIGLTVRLAGRRLHVWSTSLLKGLPIAGCRVSAYSSSNVRLGSGVSDSNGLCVIDCAGKLAPFAVVAESADSSDTSFMALKDSMFLEESGISELSRLPYLEPNECTAFTWTERGIYRHDENIFFHAILRNGKGVAPKPFPVELRLINPEGNIEQRKALMPDALGAVSYAGFSVPQDRPSGSWALSLNLPGKKDTTCFGDVSVSIEEFAPPQIRVKVEPHGDSPTNFSLSVSAEHLFGGPARNLRAEGAVAFEDIPFSSPKWKGYKFGDSKRGLNPNFRRLAKTSLDESGKASFSAPMWVEAGFPKAAVRAIAQGTVFEDGGRPASARAEKILHFYPHYIGAQIPDTVRIPESGFATIPVACVLPDGSRLAKSRRLELSFIRVESVYTCKRDEYTGWSTWSCERVEVPCSEPVTIETKLDADVPVSVPFRTGGDYILVLRDLDGPSSFSAPFWLSTWGDSTVRAPMSKPSSISIAPDKPFYRPGERPRIVVKSPFTGSALLTILRDTMIHCETFALTNATTEIVLPAAATEWSPSADVAITVIRGADSETSRQSVRAHGAACLEVRPLERELPVKVSSSVVCGGEKGSVLTADISAVHGPATGVVAVVTVVDEGINILTSQKTPDPIEHFAQPRVGYTPIWDLFARLIPIWDGDPLKISGVKTGGGFGDDLLGRVSPAPSRRFKPLARWNAAVPLTNGVGRAVFNLPEFVGEVRVTAVAYSSSAAGAASVQQKVTPKLVMQPDAPRFAAPDDSFDATLTLTDRSGKGVEAFWEISASGAVSLAKPVVGKAVISKDGSTNILVRIVAKPSESASNNSQSNQGLIRFRASGSGETHEQTIEVPVRPAVAARETAGAEILPPGKTRAFPAPATGVPEATVRIFTPATSPLAQLSSALDWLADYPHGCLEQTSSRIFPLIAAGGLLNTLTSSSSSTPGNSPVSKTAVVVAGVKRVSSMLRATNFVMWPDCNYEPHDREVSLYAAHFLIAADTFGARPDASVKSRVLQLLRRWSASTNTAVSAYACHTLALAGDPEKDRMLRLYDARAKLSLLSRARLARAFARLNDRDRAAELVKDGAEAPTSVKEASFALLALLDVDPSDARLPRLVQWLTSKRDASRLSWGTTCENAHALVALASYYRHHPFKDGTPQLTIAIGPSPLNSQSSLEAIPAKKRRVVKGGGDISISNAGSGDAWFTWRQIALPRPESVTNESSRISIVRRYLTAEGKEADLSNIERGDLLIAQIAITAPESREFADLVVQDIFPAALEPVHAPLDPSVYSWFKPKAHDWVMRSDARDDRMLVFSKAFRLAKGETATFSYPLRVVSSGEFILPGPTVEAMYAPEIHAVTAPSRIKVER